MKLGFLRLARSGRLLAAAGMATLMLILVGVGCLGGGKVREDSTEIRALLEQWLGAVNGQDWPGAYGLMSEAYRQRCPLSALVRVLEPGADSVGEVELLEVTDVLVDGDRATARVTVEHVKTGDTFSLSLDFRRDGASWRLHSEGQPPEEPCVIGSPIPR